MLRKQLTQVKAGLRQDAQEQPVKRSLLDRLPPYRSWKTDAQIVAAQQHVSSADQFASAHWEESDSEQEAAAQQQDSEKGK